MPSHLKQESADVPGNKHVISGQDSNKHDDEIRAIQKAIGVHLVDPLGGPNSDAITALSSVIAKLNSIRDEHVLTASGTVAVKDSSVIGVDGEIEFPAEWSVATLVDPMPDTELDDEDELDSMTELEISDVSDMPDEGYVSIINDVSTARITISKNNDLVVISPRVAHTKVGEQFVYSIDYVGGLGTISFSATPATSTGAIVGPVSISLSALGLALNGSDILGTSTADGDFYYLITATDGTRTSSVLLKILVAAATSPIIGTVGTFPTAEPVNTNIGVAFSYTITTARAALPTMIISPSLPAGISSYGPDSEGRFFLSGTPRVIGTTPLTVQVTDQHGAVSTRILTLNVV
jgi:hypothetical protein